MAGKFDELFKLNVNDLKEEKKVSSNSTTYKPDPKLSKDSIFRSQVRFLGDLQNPKDSWVKKLSWIIEDDGLSFFDCPSTVYEKSIIKDTFWSLYKSESAFDKRQAAKMKGKEYYYAKILIIRDPQNPELEGKVQIFKYPKQIKKIIDAAVEPTKEDIDAGAEPCNIWSPIEGKDFILKVTMKGGFWNYDECKFAPKTSAIKLGDELLTDKNPQDAFKEYNALVDSVSLDEFKYKPWTQEDRDKINMLLGRLTGKSVDVAESISKVTSREVDMTQSKPTEKTGSDKSFESFESQGKNAVKTEDAKDDIEDWLNEIGK